MGMPPKPASGGMGVRRSLACGASDGVMGPDDHYHDLPRTGHGYPRKGEITYHFCEGVI
jgi:hypothetical protein